MAKAATKRVAASAARAFTNGHGGANMSTRELATVPMSSLVHSKKNVRKTAKRSAASLAELADNIFANGVLQSLAVHEEVKRGKPTGKLAVDAGGGRLDALLLLLKQTRISADYDVPVSIGSSETATQVSLSENVHRVALHPADEFSAFQDLIDQGKSVADVAAIMGYSELTVARRLKLAAISPTLMDLYRQDGISLDQLMALTLTDDHAEQERVWSTAAPWERAPAALRRALTQDEVNSATDPLARFVGLDAYLAAGGAFRRDLFQGEHEGYLSDTALLSQLAADKLAPMADEVRAEGWQWVEVSPTPAADSIYTFRRVTAGARKATKAERAAIAQAEAALNDAQAQYEEVAAQDEDDERLRDLIRQCDAAEEQLEARRMVLLQWSKEVKAVAGAIVTLTSEGTPSVYRALVKPEDKARADKAMRASAAVEGEASADSTPAAKPEYSERLQRNLTAHRTAAIKATLASNDRVALLALTHNLALQVFGIEYLRRDLSTVQLNIHPTAHAIHTAAPSAAGSRAGEAFNALRAQWEAKLPADPKALFSWLSEQPQEEVLSLLAFCTASAIDTITGPQGATSCNERARVLMHALNLDMADWWSATGENYFAHVPKAKTLAAIGEAVSVEACAGIEAMKKAPMIEAAERLLADKRWLPTVLRS